MITEIIRTESPDRLTSMRLKEYNRFETVHVNTNLHNISVETHIDKLKERFKDEPDDLTLLVVKYTLSEKTPPFMITDRVGARLLMKMKEVKYFLQNNSLNNVHLSNLPQHFWELLGECIQGVEDSITPHQTWDEYKKLNSNVWGFKIVNPKYFIS